MKEGIILAILVVMAGGGLGVIAEIARDRKQWWLFGLTTIVLVAAYVSSVWVFWSRPSTTITMYVLGLAAGSTFAGWVTSLWLRRRSSMAGKAPSTEDPAHDALAGGSRPSWT